MLGREAYHRPVVIAELDAALYPKQGSRHESSAEESEREPLDREAMLERMARYASREIARGERLSAITRHMLGLYSGEPGAREYRRTLSEGARAADAGPDLIRQAAPAATEFAESRSPQSPGG